MGAMSRRKGATWERRVVNDLKARGLDAKRTAQLQTYATNDAPDVSLPGWFIECKVGKQPSPRAALRQALGACPDDGRIPVAVIKDNGSGARAAFAFAVLRYQDWLALVAEIERANGPRTGRE